MKVYISGPITGADGYMERFARAERALLAEGHTVVNPARVNAQLPKCTTHGEYMGTSIAMLGMCSAMYMLKGWEGSEGCREELAFACRNGITITFEGGRG